MGGGGFLVLSFFFFCFFFVCCRGAEESEFEFLFLLLFFFLFSWFVFGWLLFLVAYRCCICIIAWSGESGYIQIEQLPQTLVAISKGLRGGRRCRGWGGRSGGVVDIVAAYSLADGLV